jgi:aryl-alcohol dehydrogenase-like predicted oxidoreductase
MERRELGRTGLQVSVLGFGGSEIGFERAEPGMVRTLLQEALDAGLNVIDTAECYGDSEALVGQAVADRRSEYYLFTKCGHFEGTGRDDWSSASLEKSITRSLARLRTDHVDLLQLHTCTEDDLRRGDVIEVVERARQRGQTRFIGYSGDGPAARYAVECGRFDTLQTSINVADQEAMHLTLPLAQARGVGVIAKRPIANAAWRTGERPANAYHHAYWDRLKQLDYELLRRPSQSLSGRRCASPRLFLGVNTLIAGARTPRCSGRRAAAKGPLRNKWTRSYRFAEGVGRIV